MAVDTKGKIYIDDKLEELTRMYPVANTLGLLYKLLIMDVLKPSYGADVFEDSPAKNREAGILFGELLSNAAREGRWVGYDTLWTPSKPAYVKKARAENLELSPKAVGIAQALDARLLRLEITDGRVFAVPTEYLIKFVRSTLSRSEF